jgi:hypothetical protein
MLTIHTQDLGGTESASPERSIEVRDILYGSCEAQVDEASRRSKNDVGGSHIQMNVAFGVHVVECRGNFEQQRDGDCDVQRPVPTDSGEHRGAKDPLEAQVRSWSVQRGVQAAHKPRVVESARGLDLAMEASEGTRVARAIGAQHFDDDGT